MMQWTVPPRRITKSKSSIFSTSYCLNQSLSACHNQEKSWCTGLDQETGPEHPCYYPRQEEGKFLSCKETDKLPVHSVNSLKMDILAKCSLMKRCFIGQEFWGQIIWPNWTACCREVYLLYHYLLVVLLWIHSHGYRLSIRAMPGK